MSSPLVSIIIPIYKVEPYLRRCLDSIVNQTYTNLEIILVDDGSPDGSPQICDEYAAKDNRILVIHKENGGLSDARNAGLDICKGEYISFVDSDDWVDKKYIETLYNTIIETGADISIINHCQFSSDETFLPLEKFHTGIFAGYNCLKQLIINNTIQHTLVWGKLYKKTLFNNIRFPVGKKFEDNYVSYQLYFFSKKIACKDIVLYHYLKRSDSIMGAAQNIDYTQAWLEQAKFFEKQKCRELANVIYYRLSWSFLRRFQICIKKKDKIASTENLKQFSHFCKKTTYPQNCSKLSFAVLKFFSICPQSYILYKKIIG